MLALLVALFAQDQTDEARKLVDAVAARMKDSPAIAFEAELSMKIDLPLKLRGDPPEPKPAKISVRIKRPNLARIETVRDARDDDERKSTIVLDGKWMWSYSPSSQTYRKCSQAIWRLGADCYGGEVLEPLLRLFYSNGPGDLLESLGGAFVSREKELSMVSWTTNGPRYQIGIDDKNRIRRCVYRIPIATGMGGQAIYTLVLGDVDLAPKLADDTFVFNPPKEAKEVKPVPSAWDAHLLPADSRAPDIDTVDLEGAKVKLSDYRGNRVILFFWQYGNPAAHEELRCLQRLHQDYKDRGVVVLAVGYQDYQGRMRKYFEREKIPFRPIDAQAPEIRKAYKAESFHPAAYYVIDGEGKISDRCVGFDEERLRAALDRGASKK